MERSVMIHLTWPFLEAIEQPDEHTYGKRVDRMFPFDISWQGGMDDDKHEKEGHQGIHQETDTIYLYISGCR